MLVATILHRQYIGTRVDHAAILLHWYIVLVRLLKETYDDEDNELWKSKKKNLIELIQGEVMLFGYYYKAR